jgi:hypothetical protein
MCGIDHAHDRLVRRAIVHAHDNATDPRRTAATRRLRSWVSIVLCGRFAIITGSNTGIGYQAAAVLAESGAHVVLAVRNTELGRNAPTLVKPLFALAPPAASTR